MRRLIFVAAALVALPTSALAANCTDQWTAINDLLVRTRLITEAVPGIVRQSANGGCRIDHVDLPMGPSVVIETDRIAWTASDADRFVADGLPPVALTLQASGIRIVPNFGDEAMSYLNRIQMRGRTIDLFLNAKWSEEERRLSLNALNLEFPEDDHVHFSAEIEGVDLTSRNTIQMSAGSMALTRSVTDVRSTRLFQDYLLQPLGLALLFGSEDPEARVAELKNIARGYLADVPSDILPQASQDALLTLLDQMPDPSGRLRIEKTAEPGIGPARFATFAMRTGGINDMDQIWEALRGLKLHVTYEPL